MHHLRTITLVLALALAPAAYAQQSADTDYSQEAIQRYLAEVHPDVGYLVRLKMMRAHLGAAVEARAQQQVDESVMHIHHPMEEIWPELRPELDRRGVTQVQERLAELELVAKTRDLIKIDAAIKACEAAIIELENKTLQSPNARKYLPDVAAVLLRVAVVEYHEAFEGKVLKNPLEFRDGAYFVREARSILNMIAPDLKSKDAAAFEKMSSTLERLYSAWPEGEPPNESLVSIVKLQSLVTMAELQMNRLR
jgi:hypothetical protein